jgi:hyperosmotically inducible periplasmic protein
MKSERRTLIGGLTLAAAIALSPLVFAQENPAPSGPMPMAGAGASATQASDPSLMQKAKAALASDPATKDATIEVEASNGMVKLTGQVDSKATAEHAQQVVAQIDGVKSVDNELKTKSD